MGHFDSKFEIEAYKDLERAFTCAACRPIAYRRFPEELLADNPCLNRLGELLDSRLLAGAAVLHAPELEFGHLTSLAERLAGAGKPLFTAALNHETSSVSLR